MRVKLTLLILMAVSLLIFVVGYLRAIDVDQVPATASLQERPEGSVKVLSGFAMKEVGTLINATDDPVSSEAKADWIEKALASDSPEMNAKGNQLLREMVSEGSVSDVLAALPKATFFSEETAREIAALQGTLCRFQQPDDLAFEMIKLKFNLVFKHQAGIKPWPAICRAG